MNRHLEEEKAKQGNDKFNRTVARKIAEIQSQIHERKLKGLPEDPKLVQVKDILAKFLN